MRAIIPAKWLNYETGEYKNATEKYGNPCPYFRKEFLAKDKEIKSATLSVSAFGVFKVYINGVEADNDYMSPGWTEYRKRIPLLEIDVKDKICKENAIVIVAGDGWAVGHIGNRMHRCNYSDKILVIAKLTILYADGEKDVIVTDEDWKATTGEILRTDNYMGEVVDHNKTLPQSFYKYGYTGQVNDVNALGGDANGFSGRLCEEVAPRTRVMHTLGSEFLGEVKGYKIFDMKQNMVGDIRVLLKGNKFDKVEVIYGEMLNADGSVYMENLRRAEATDHFILSGEGDEEFRPLFTFHGFRYVGIKVEGDVAIKSLVGEVMYSDLKQAGTFSCSSQNINQLYSNIVWGQRGNFLNVPTDCPQRDERLGWTGDAQIFCGSAMFNMDCEKFFDKYIQDLIDAQKGVGAIPGIAPIVPHPHIYGAEDANYSSAGWADAITVIPYEHYLMYGDKSKLRYALVFIKKYIEFLVWQSEDLIRPEEPNYGDWLNVDSHTIKSLLSTEYFAYSTYLTAKICDILGDEDKDKYYSLFEDIKKAFRKEFLLPDGKLKSHTQTAYLLAYSFNLLSKEEMKDNLIDTIRKADDKLTTGFLGVKFLLPVLCELGEQDLAYKILANEEYPGWLYSVVNGATTIWERWNSYTVEGGFGDVRMNSFNHYSLGSCSEWMFKFCLGIMPEEQGAGFKKMTLRPFIDRTGKLTHAKGSYESRMGKIEVSWRVENGKAYYDAIVPKEIDLTLDIPSDVIANIKRS